MGKGYTPFYQYPTEKTGFFEGELADGKRVKDIKDVPHEAYGGWWPSFFPSAVGLLATGDGSRDNVMSVACTVVVNAYPFMLGFPMFTQGESTRGDGPRYSLTLLEASREFTLNVPVISPEMTKKVIICGSLSGRDGLDKFAKAGLTRVASRHVRPPVLKECPLNFECAVEHMQFLGSHTWVIGKVLAVHLDEDMASGEQRLLWRSMAERVDPANPAGPAGGTPGK